MGKKEDLFVLFLFLIGIFLYGLTLKGIPGTPSEQLIKNNLDQKFMPFELSPERGRYALLLSLADNQSFALSKTLAEAAYPDVGYYQGRYYVFFAPGISLISLPFFEIGKTIFQDGQVAAYATISVFAILNMIILYLIGRNIFKFPNWLSAFCAFTFAFATTSWSYAVTLYQHHITIFFILSAFYAIWRFRQKGPNSWIWGVIVWLNFGLAIFVDYPNALLMTPIIVYYAISSVAIKKSSSSYSFSLRPEIIITSLVFIVLAILHGYYNYTNFGDWKRLSGSLVGVKAIEAQNLPNGQELNNVIESLESKKQPVRFFKEDNLPRGFYELTVAPDKGLLLFSPIFLLALIGIITTPLFKITENKVLMAIILVNIFLYSSFGDPWGGWAFGPRYLIPSMAILTLFIGQWLKHIRFSLISRVVGYALFIFSAAISLVGVLTTNAVPPKVEADYLNTKYNFLLNFDYLFQGKSSSFAYNTFFSHYVSLTQYYFMILIVVLATAFWLLFVIPMRRNYEH